MNKENLFDIIKEVIAEHIDCDADEIKTETTLEELGLDSLDAVELIMKVEEKINFPLELNKYVPDVGGLVDFVYEKVNAGEQAK